MDSENTTTNTGDDPNESAQAPPDEVIIPAGEIDETPRVTEKVRELLIGKPRDLSDRNVFQHVSLIAFLAWVGLGADGLSSSCYGPAEAFHHLQGHESLAVFLSLATIATVFVISMCYSHIIEEFPAGGGGYLVASKLLGRGAGLVSGCALIVDYVLTVTVSIAAAGDALFGLLPPADPGVKIACELGAIIVLMVLNLRGVKESITLLVPIFMTFLICHIVLIGGSIGLHLLEIGAVARDVSSEVQADLSDPSMGLLGVLAILLHAYSMGAGTYTGIEAVSNSMPVMREPRVATAKKTMAYMAVSLSLTAGGLMLAYLLLDVREQPNRTMNQTLTEIFVSDAGLTALGLGGAFVLLTMISEGALLIVAAQAGFIDGPRILANMAHDSWAPHWFGSLSERLSAHNGVMLIGIAAMGALFYTEGNVSTLVIMYSINVFLTFSLSMIGMCRYWWQLRNQNPVWRRRLSLFLLGATLCMSVLGITIYEKFFVGGWVTLVATGALIGVCFLVRWHYKRVLARLKRLDATLEDIAAGADPNNTEPSPDEPTAVILVGGYGGLGVHTLLNAIRFAPNHFKSMVFVSVGVVDSGVFKGAAELDALRAHTAKSLERYVDLARRLGMPATSYMAIGADAVEELETLCKEVSKRFPKAIFFAGQLVFHQDSWYDRLLHNQTAFFLQRRLQWDGIPMVIMPTRVR